MSLILITIFRLLLGVIPFAFVAPCKASSGQGFTFPQVSSSSSSSLNFYNITVQKHDSMVITYTPFEYTTAIDIAIYCFDSVQDAVSNQTKGFVDGGWDYYDGSYKNTGLLLWDFTNGVETSRTPFCGFVLFNASFDSCTWGPWNQVTEYSLGVNSSTPFSYSSIFQVSNATSENSTLWISEVDADVPASMTATATAQVTCPPSGIPPSPIPTHWQVDTWPPLEGNMTFPI